MPEKDSALYFGIPQEMHFYAPPTQKKPRRRYICAHGKQSNLCKDCGGSSLCREHGIQRNQCIKCGGKGVCPHGRIRWQCAECGGASMCLHGRRKARCRECGGNDICVHDRIKYNCRVCKTKSAAEKQAATNLAGFYDPSNTDEETPRFIALVRAACRPENFEEKLQ